MNKLSKCFWFHSMIINISLLCQIIYYYAYYEESENKQISSKAIKCIAVAKTNGN